MTVAIVADTRAVTRDASVLFWYFSGKDFLTLQWSNGSSTSSRGRPGAEGLGCSKSVIIEKQIA